jgi:hypothetical protein
MPFMKFTLTYDGRLPPSANKPKNDIKWEIRKRLHPQLYDLWTSHPALRAVEEHRHFPKVGGAALMQTHHPHPGPIHPPVYAPIIGGVQALDLGNFGDKGRSAKEILDLCEPLQKHGAWFRPLIRESYALHCGLSIRFLRKESPGKVYQGGDLDGRMKTLLDALAMPQHFEQILEKDSTQHSPIYCLLEDDSMISGLDVESERLLGDQSNQKDWVKLTVEVDVRVRQATVYNQSFLG